MANAPGPDPIFTERLNIKVRPEMKEELDRLAAAIGLTTSEVARVFLDMALDAARPHPIHSKEPAHGEV